MNIRGYFMLLMSTIWRTVVTQLKATFRYRVAGGADNSSLPESNGRAVFKKVYGNTVKWNQLATVKSGQRTGGAYVDIMAISYAGSPHKFYFKFKVSSTNGGRLILIGKNAQGSYFETVLTYSLPSELTEYTYIPSSPIYGYQNAIYIRCTYNDPSTIVAWDDAMCFDLTAQEYPNIASTTPTKAEVEAWLALNGGQQGYYPPDEGSLISFKGQGVKSVGFNKWDEQAISGTLNSANGAVITPYNNRIVSANYIKVLPNTKYSTNKKKECLICFYDKDYNTLQYVKVNSADAGVAGMAADAYQSSNTFVTPANCAYIKFSAIGYSLPYANDLCINISDDVKNGTYEPYWKDEADLSFISTLEDGNGNLLFPDGELRKAGSAEDWVTETEGEKNNGSVDLGSLNWRNYKSYGFYAPVPNVKEFPANEGGNGVIYGYIAVGRSATLTTGQFTVANGHISIVNSTVETDPVAFAAFINGLEFIYELATPVTATHDDEMRYKVDKYSTEELLVPASVDGSPTSTNIVADIEYQSK